MQSLIKSDEGNIIGHPTLTAAAANGGKSDEAPIFGAKMRPNTKEAAQFGARKWSGSIDIFCLLKGQSVSWNHKIGFFLSARTSFVSKTYLLGDISMKMSNKTIISDCNILPLCKTPLLDWNSNIGVKILPNTATSLPNIVSSKIEVCICFAKLKVHIYMGINQIFEWKRTKYNFSLWASFFWQIYKKLFSIPL